MKIYNFKNEDWKYDALVATECDECFIRVSGIVEDKRNREDGTLWLWLFSDHAGRDQISWKWRIKNAWNMLRGNPEPQMEIFTREIVDNLIQALAEGRDKVFALETKE